MNTECADVNIKLDKIEPKKGKKRENVPDVLDVEMKECEEKQPNNNRLRAKRGRKLSESRMKKEIRRIPVPAHRYSPLKENWMKIFTPIVEHLNLHVRFNLQTRHVEIKASDATTDIGNLQKAADFVKAFIYGFDADDALALLRLDDLFVESFEIKDVKTLTGDHRSRAIGRLAGEGGRTKYTIENATKTRIVLADSKIHILGSFQNIQLARRAVCNLILGAPPSKIYGQLKTNKVSGRL